MSVAPPHPSLLDLVSCHQDAQVAAFLSEDGEAVSFRELFQTAARITSELCSVDSCAGTTLVLLPRSSTCAAAALACCSLGRTFLLLGDLADAQQLQLLRQILEDHGDAFAAAIVAQARAAQVQELLRPLAIVSLSHDGRSVLDEHNIETRSGCLKDYIASLALTSGSSGRPKLVGLSADALCNRFLWAYQHYPLQDAELWAWCAPTIFVDSLWQLLGGLGVGVGTLVVQQQGDGRRLCSLVRRFAVTRMTLVPTVAGALGRAATDIGEDCLRSLQWLALSGEPFPLRLACDLRGLLSKECTLLNIYGSAETTADCCAFEVPADPLTLLPSLPTSAASFVPLGHPLKGPLGTFVVRLAEDGEILVAGLGASPAAADSDGWVAMGDIGCWSTDGLLLFIHRRGRRIKVGGAHADLDALAEVLQQQPCVERAVVNAGRNGQLIAYVQTRHVRGPLGTRLRRTLVAALRAAVPAGPVPSRFILTRQLPQTASGKVMLRQKTSCPRPHRRARSTLHPLRPGLRVSRLRRSAVARAVAHILGLRPRAVSMDLNLVALGLDSMSFILLSVRLENLGITLERHNFQSFRAEPTLRSLLTMARPSRKRHHSAGEMKEIQRSIVPNIHQPAAEVEACPRSKTNAWCFAGRRVQLQGGHGHATRDLPVETGCTRIVERERSREREEGQVEEHRLPCCQGPIHHLWSVPCEGCVDAAPVIVEEPHTEFQRVIVASHSGTVRCLSSLDGSELWRRGLPNRVEAAAVACSTSGGPCAVVGSHDGSWTFMSVSSGQTIWRHCVDSPVRAAALVSSTGHVWCGSQAKRMHKLDPRAHAEVLSLPCAGSVVAAPCEAADGAVLWGDLSGMLYCCGSDNNSMRWSRQLSAPLFAGILVPSAALGHQGVLGAVAAAVDGNLRAVQLADGSDLWDFAAPAPVFASLLEVSNGLLVACGDRTLRCLSRSEGACLWAIDLGGRAVAPGVCFTSQGEEHVLVAATCGLVQIVKLAHEAEGQGTPQKVAEADLGVEAFSSPMLCGQQLFLGGRDERLHCLELGLQVDAGIDL